MKISILAVLLLPVLATAQTDTISARKAQQSPQQPAHTPEWTNPNDSDPGVSESTAPDLQRIVVLCATKPNSAEFGREWQSYIQRHYRRGMDVDVLIDDVLKRADAHRKSLAGNRNNPATRSLRAQDTTNTRKAMHDAAMASIRNMK
jgi:hypothetical protein